MTTFIVLTDAQASHVRGPSVNDPAAALNPAERAGGVFILSASVIDDPAHETHTDYLGALPTMDTADPAFPASIDPPEAE